MSCAFLHLAYTFVKRNIPAYFGDVAGDIHTHIEVQRICARRAGPEGICAGHAGCGGHETAGTEMVKLIGTCGIIGDRQMMELPPSIHDT